MSSQIAAQLYTLRDFLKTPADIAKTLAKVSKIGFKSVQLSALGPIDAKELRKILDNEGLTCCATHVGLERLRDKPQEIIEQHQIWGVKYTALGHHKVHSGAEWIAFANEFSGYAKTLAQGGVQLGYHNHSHELIKYDGQTALDIIFKTVSKEVWMEIDTYWITHGGGEPSAWIDKVAGRIPCVHFKDLGIAKDGAQQMREVGEGNLNWPRVIESCKNAGVEWYIIEQDNCNGLDQFDCLARSLKNLNALGIK